MLTLIVVATAVPIGYSFLPEVTKRKKQIAAIEALRGEVEEQQLELARNKSEEYLLKHDPEFQAIFARDKLGLMKDGEVIYRLEMKTDPSKFRLQP